MFSSMTWWVVVWLLLAVGQKLLGQSLPAVKVELKQSVRGPVLRWMGYSETPYQMERSADRSTWHCFGPVHVGRDEVIEVSAMAMENYQSVRVVEASGSNLKTESPMKLAVCRFLGIGRCGMLSRLHRPRGVNRKRDSALWNARKRAASAKSFPGHKEGNGNR